jgi:hypothetical protein
MTLVISRDRVILKRGLDERTYMLKQRNGLVSTKARCLDQQGREHGIIGINELYYSEGDSYAKDLLESFIVHMC